MQDLTDFDWPDFLRSSGCLSPEASPAECVRPMVVASDVLRG